MKKEKKKKTEQKKERDYTNKNNKPHKENMLLYSSKELPNSSIVKIKRWKCKSCKSFQT